MSIKNEKGVTVVNRSGLIKLEEIYKTTIFEDEPIDEETKQRELLEILSGRKKYWNYNVCMSSSKLRINSLLQKMNSFVLKMCKLAKKTSSLISNNNWRLLPWKTQKRLQLELNEAKAEVEEIQTKSEEKIQEEAAPKGFLARLFGGK